MKWTPEQVAQLLNMKTEGFSNAEIAEAIGFPAQTVHNKISDLKKLNGGVLPTKYTGKRKYTVADVTPYKPEVEEADRVYIPAESVNETTENVIEETENVIEETETVIEETETQFETVAKSEPETQRDTPKTETHMETVDKSKRCHSMQNPIVYEPPRPDIVDLAYKAKFMANDLGFTLDHLMVDLGNVRDDISISGKDAHGKVYEIRLSVTDPAKFPKGDTCPTKIPPIG